MPMKSTCVNLIDCYKILSIPNIAYNHINLIICMKDIHNFHLFSVINQVTDFNRLKRSMSFINFKAFNSFR
jgi:hypothetical protein